MWGVVVRTISLRFAVSKRLASQAGALIHFVPEFLLSLDGFLIKYKLLL